MALVSRRDNTTSDPPNEMQRERSTAGAARGGLSTRTSRPRPPALSDDAERSSRRPSSGRASASIWRGRRKDSRINDVRARAGELRNPVPSPRGAAQRNLRHAEGGLGRFRRTIIYRARARRVAGSTTGGPSGTRGHGRSFRLNFGRERGTPGRRDVVRWKTHRE